MALPKYSRRIAMVVAKSALQWCLICLGVVRYLVGGCWWRPPLLVDITFVSLCFDEQRMAGCVWCRSGG